LLEVPAETALALAPLPALSEQRRNVALLDPFTSTAMLDRPLPAVSVPDAAGDVNAMSSMSTALAPAAIVSAA
jgi:hypothetical protein